MVNSERNLAARLSDIALGRMYSDIVLRDSIAALRNLHGLLQAGRVVEGVGAQAVAEAITACEQRLAGADASHFALQDASLLISRWVQVDPRVREGVKALSSAGVLPATEDPAFKAQMAALREVTASINAAEAASRNYWNADQEPDPRPGNFYVTSMDSGIVFPMAGPFVNDHASALAAVGAVKDAAGDRDGRALFMAWGTTRMPETYSAPGPLNSIVKALLPKKVSRFDDYLVFKREHADRITVLANALGEIEDDAHWELVDEMKTLFGSNAANDSGDDADRQDAVLDVVEEMVSQTCSDGGVQEDVAMALWLRGHDGGEAYLRSQVVQESRPAPRA